MIYHFEHSTHLGTVIEHSRRELPDDFAAVDWMGNEMLLAGDSIRAFRADAAIPFARRRFAGDVEIVE